MSSADPCGQAGNEMDGDGYDGPAELLTGDTAIGVSVTLRGHFDPISGSYHWYGRVGASAEVAGLIESGTRAVMLRTPHAQLPTALRDIDPWGRPRVSGFGPAPFPVRTAVPVQD